MRKLFILLGLVCPFVSVIAQQIIKVDNTKYFDSNHNLFTGVYEENYDNGNKKLEMHLLNGEQDSTTTLWFENGKISEVRSYKQGLKHGKWETFNEAGVKTAEAWYSGDKKSGRWLIWDDEGNLRFEMGYKNGEKCGDWKILSSDGKVISAKKYELDCQ